MQNKVALPKKIVDILVNTPESGMGYHVVTIKLKNGELLFDRKVINCTYLLLTENENITKENILAVSI